MAFRARKVLGTFEKRVPDLWFRIPDSEFPDSEFPRAPTKLSGSKNGLSLWFLASYPLEGMIKLMQFSSRAKRKRFHRK